MGGKLVLYIRRRPRALRDGSIHSRAISTYNGVKRETPEAYLCVWRRKASPVSPGGRDREPRARRPRELCAFPSLPPFYGGVLSRCFVRAVGASRVPLVPYGEPRNQKIPKPPSLASQERRRRRKKTRSPGDESAARLVPLKSDKGHSYPPLGCCFLRPSTFLTSTLRWEFAAANKRRTPAGVVERGKRTCKAVVPRLRILATVLVFLLFFGEVLPRI